MNFLIADDHTLILEGFEYLLKKNYSSAFVFKAKSGSEAIEVIKNSDIEILITDHYCPFKDSSKPTEVL